MHDDRWRVIIQVYQLTKELLLIGEEINEEFDSYLQPREELNRAYDHCMRARAAELGLPAAEPGSEDGESSIGSYAETQYDKMLGHQYRAFFDAADELAVVIRKRLIDLMGEYDTNTIREVWPEYYPKVRPEIERLNLEIAGIRKKKDIGCREKIIEEVSKYRRALDDLLGYLKEAVTKVSPLEEHKGLEDAEREADERRERRRRIAEIIGGLLIAGFGALVGWFLGRYHGS